MSKHQDPGVPLSGKQLVDGLADHWGKILVAILLKLGKTDIELTPEDLERLNDPKGFTIVPGGPANPHNLRIRVMPYVEAIAEAKKYRGGFGHS